MQSKCCSGWSEDRLASCLGVCCLPACCRLGVQSPAPPPCVCTQPPSCTLHLASALSPPTAPLLHTPPCTSQVQEKEDTYKQTRIDALFGAARVRAAGAEGMGGCAWLLFCPAVDGEVCHTLLRPTSHQSKRRPHLALEGGEQQQQQQQGAGAIGDLEDFGANPAAAAAAAAGPVGIATSLDPEAAAAEAAAAAGREGENAPAAANQADEEMPDRCGAHWYSLSRCSWLVLLKLVAAGLGLLCSTCPESQLAAERREGGERRKRGHPAAACPHYCARWPGEACGAGQR